MTVSSFNNIKQMTVSSFNNIKQMTVSSISDDSIVGHDSAVDISASFDMVMPTLPTRLERALTSPAKFWRG